jgi:thymidylate synthase
MKQYIDLVKHVLENGTRKENRTGVDTLSTFNYNYVVDLRDGFPLLTTKEVSWKNIVIENLWFLSGRTDIKLLQKHGCKFWDPWADESGLVPSAYGRFWRNFPSHGNSLGFSHPHLADYFSYVKNDQVQWVVDELKRNPMSRRCVVSAWAPENAQHSKLPPCHAMWILNVQNELDGSRTLNLHLTQRSADIALGVPYNVAGYALILHLISRFTNIPVGRFAHSLIDAHIYTSKSNGEMSEYDHIPGLKAQISREPRALPSLEIDESIKSLDDIEKLFELSTEEIMSKFIIKGYEPHQKINFKVAV